ncbi:MAG: methyl-accepting chemotaxis protein [Deltaproteobacteria bacterium]|nr:methyl-accepting chemotaxis protein [Deltaproteobacteria bacterium]MBW2020932.1 methyl-accepting chemotaxis protein [Deltaproteobacteria bacterium]MBW2075726.1 methyl-accepting chemotaxis protein [Deltaproteobacteria bacterium]
MITLNIRGENAMVKAQMKHQGHRLFHSVEASMNGSLAVGNNEMVRQQFWKFKEEIPDADIFVFDFKKAIAFATDLDVGEKGVDTLIKDKAAIKAIARMLENGEEPAEPFEEWINGIPYLTIFYPILNEAQCFHCHGSSRKVLGGAMIRVSAQKAFATIRAARNRNIVIGAVGLGIIIMLIYASFQRLVNRQIQVLLGATRRIGEGDLTCRCEVKGRNEMSHICQQINDMSDNLRNMFKDILSGSETMASSSAELSAISQKMSLGAEQTSEKSSAVATAAEEMSANMTSVASAMEQTSTNVGMMATAAEQMTATIHEIAQNSETARSITDEAVSQAQRASAKIEELGKAANEIGMVTETITEISEQTNLLALNANIEAARAEVNQNVAQSSAVSAEIAKDISDVNQAAAEMSNSSSQINLSAQKLSKLADQLKEMVKRFSV